MKKKLGIYIVVYLLFFLISLLLFSATKSSENNPSFLKDKLRFNGGENNGRVDEPKTEPCPLNGKLYTKTNKQTWETRRPLGIMIENSTDARPQSGLGSADVIFEAVAEGGITRFLAVYYCQEEPVVGPVRSARVYFIDFISGFGKFPLYAHVGGANTPGPADALGQIEEMGWDQYNDLNQFSIGFPVFWRDYERLPGVATEHTMYSNTNRLWEVAAKRGLDRKDKKGVSWDVNFTSWSFKDDVAISQRPSAFVVSFGFWENYPDFNVRWQYDSKNNAFLRFNGGEPHFDKNTGKQLWAKNVVVVFMEESVANDGYDKGEHLLYETIGEGDAVVFQDGVAQEATWKKESRDSQIVFVDKKKEEIHFNRGQIWIEVIPTGNKLEYK